MPSRLRGHSVELWVHPCRVPAQFRSMESELATSGGPRVQRVPRSQRVHIISTMNDLSIGDGNDRDEPIVIGHARSQDPAVHLVFDDHNSAVVGMINDKLVG